MLPDALSAAIWYCALKLPLESVLIGSGLIVVPSQLAVGSLGRFAVVPPGSEHSIIWSPLESSARVGNPVPETVMVWPSVNGPVAGLVVTVGPAPKACPERIATPITVQISVRPPTCIIENDVLDLLIGCAPTPSALTLALSSSLPDDNQMPEGPAVILRSPRAWHLLVRGSSPAPCPASAARIRYRPGDELAGVVRRRC
ncbi:MAG: hypothetical protein ABSH04_08355, partial [Acidimicrobiales bacterium]